MFAMASACAVPVSIVCLALADRLAKTQDLTFLIPLSFVARGVVLYAFKFVENPDTWSFYGLVALMIGLSSFEFIFVQSLYMRKMPKNIRGAMMMINSYSMVIFGALFNFICGPIFDNIAPHAPYTMSAYCDAAFAVIALILGVSGKLRPGNP